MAVKAGDDGREPDLLPVPYEAILERYLALLPDLPGTLPAGSVSIILELFTLSALS